MDTSSTTTPVRQCEGCGHAKCICARASMSRSARPTSTNTRSAFSSYSSRRCLPVLDFFVVDGIPSTDKEAEVIGALREAGIKHVAFKPGSVVGIRPGVIVVAASPLLPIIMQWMPGREPLVRGLPPAYPADVRGVPPASEYFACLRLGF